MKENKELSGDELCRLVVHGMLEKKAANIVVMDMRKVKNSITDFFVICQGNTDTQIDAIATSVDDEVFKASKINPWHQEGKQNKEWILLDYIDVVVHVFRKDRRKFYDLESLWGDAIITQIEESIEPEQEKQMLFIV
jgi:ribosome-associated protein